MIYIKEIIPYEKDIKFDTKINEITSISLEHEEDLRLDDIEGLFIISGDYKIHPISVNKEEFKYKIPFNIELSDTINKESIKLDIIDFTYDIIENDTLRIKIDLEFKYDLKEIEEKEQELDRETKEKEQELDREIEELIEDDNIKDITETIEKEEKVEQTSTSQIIKDNQEDTYVTYHVHIVNQEDNIESICLKYNIDKTTLLEYNTFDELKVNDKILIPIKDE